MFFLLLWPTQLHSIKYHDSETEAQSHANWREKRDFVDALSSSRKSEQEIDNDKIYGESSVFTWSKSQLRIVFDQFFVKTDCKNP